ncbi:MAG: acyl carrier protein [Fulvivirga sp.]|uniref:acyl carrier protein n=1 Tax=Fulvivirga sp. TaxID=1931237 RepID=UPI0032EF8793
MFSSQTVGNFIKHIISQESGISINEIKESQSFFELGLDSISAIYLLELVENEYQIALTPLDFWDYPTIAEFSNYLVTTKLAK